jgi:NADH-quinone oxidoreductase subunit G
MSEEPKTVNVTIDGRTANVPEGTLLWEAAKSMDIDVPIFCYHPKMGPVGVCRMCLVDVAMPNRDGVLTPMPKPQTACTTAVSNGMVVHTKSPDVEKAQRGILEFLLINHPLDCPICDRGGECPLQDQTFNYGPGVSRFIERKRHFLKPIPLGPTIALDRERCILCWRCVRFTSEIAEDNQLILSDRGSHSYIATYESEPYVSDFSGNVIELCPVGALTSRKQRFDFRPWEMKQHPSVCPNCAMGCNIQMDVRGAQRLVRFRSRTNDEIDDGWLCDRGRFGYDFIQSEDRLTTPLIRRDGALQPGSWPEAYRVIAENFQRIAASRSPESIAGIASSRLVTEDLFVFTRFMTETVGSHQLDYWPRPRRALGPEQAAAVQRLQARIKPISAIDSARVIILVGANPSARTPVMELRIRKAVNKLGASLVEIGELGTPLSSKAVASVQCQPNQLSGLLLAFRMGGDLPGASTEFDTARSLLAESDGPFLVIYDDYFEGVPKDAHSDVLEAIDAFVESLAERVDVGVIPLLARANEMAARDLGLGSSGTDASQWGQPVFDRIAAGEFGAAWLAGASPEAAEAIRSNLDFLVVSELRLSAIAQLADVVLPAAAFAERVGIYVNTGRQLNAFGAALPAPGVARPEWQIFTELSQYWDNPLSYARSEQVLADIARLPVYAGLVPSSYVKTVKITAKPSSAALAFAE